VVKKLNSPNLKLMLDVFHLQQLHGNLTRNIKEMLPYVGECLHGDTVVVKSRAIFSAGSSVVILCLGQRKQKLSFETVLVSKCTKIFFGSEQHHCGGWRPGVTVSLG
jgi:hypothetical protein